MLIRLQILSRAAAREKSHGDNFVESPMNVFLFISDDDDRILY